MGERARVAVTAASHPCLHAAFVAIEVDNGGHLIGTVYPGTPIDLVTFQVPVAWAALLAPAEAGLARLKAEAPGDFETFLCGEEGECEAIRTRQGDLDVANRVIGDYFDGWPAEDAPGRVQP